MPSDRSGTKAGSAESARQANGLPQSMAALRVELAEQLTVFRRLEARCWTRQHQAKHDDDDAYASIDEDAERLSFGDYRAALRERERNLKAMTPPAVWRAVVKELKAQGERIDDDG